MILTYILIDFENLQPQADDLSLLRGDEFRVRIFHGVHQNKFDVGMYKALQPLGDRVELIQSDRQGPDVLDFHVSFYLGRLLQEHLDEKAAAKGARFFVISKDKGFDSLLVHVRTLGFEAHRVATIQGALGTHAAPPARKAAAKKAAPAKRAPAAKKVAAKAAPAAKAAAREPKKAAEDPKHVVLDSLRKMGQKRPGKRKGLEHHIESHLGRKFDFDAVRELVAEMERAGWLRITDNKVEYTLPKAKK
jgi:hypothetical protein